MDLITEGKMEKLVKLFIVILFVSIFLVILHQVAGHKIIASMYYGKSFAFLNDLIKGQNFYPLKHYLQFSDQLLVYGLLCVNLFVILLCFSVGRHFIFLFFIAIVFLEIGLRILEPCFPKSYINDPVLGVRYRPFQEGANSLGFNDKEYPKEKNNLTTRIIALGDSFNWAGGYEMNYWTLAEQILNNSNRGKSIEILNQGTPMIGPAYELRLLKAVSMNFEPDIVVLAFFVGNDFGESDMNNFRIERFGYPLDIRLNERRRFPYVDLRDSYLWFFIDHRWEDFANTYNLSKEKRDGLRTGSFSKRNFLQIEAGRIAICTSPFYQSMAWLETRERILDFKNYLSQKGALFLILILPDEYQVNKSLRQEIFKEFSELKAAQYDFELPQKQLGRFLTDHNIEYLDLLPAFKSQAKDHELYLFRDTHFNNFGNSLASKEVAQFLKSRIQHLNEQKMGQLQQSPVAAKWGIKFL